MNTTFVETSETIGLIKDIAILVQKDAQQEWRERSAFNGILLYVVSTVFLAYLVFNSLESLTTWIALFWIVLLFASTNASLQSFKHESGRQFFYYYSLVSPQAIILAKMIYNAGLLLLIAITNYLLFSVLLGNPIENNWGFLLSMLLSSLGFSGVLTLISGIAAKTNNNSTLTAILAFPIMLPILLTAIKVSLLSGLGFGWDECGLYFGLLALINVVILALAYILFPYLWRS